MKVQATDSIFGFPIGETTLHTHSSKVCAGRNCPVHNPSDHHMKDWPMLWRGDRALMERTCPHGVGHPDPDGLAYELSIGHHYQAIHGCDGCCHV